MRKIKCITVLFMLTIINLNAQSIADHTLGLRLGDSDGFGAEITYQKAIAGNNRAEFNLGFRNSRQFDAFKLAGVYQWVHQLDGNFNWYYGFGGGLGNVDFEPIPNNNNGFNDDDDGFFLFAAGNLGIEYDFDIPLLISLDIRPEIGLLGFGGFDNSFLFDIALGLRYQF